jgi:NDP-sugar pyrophosphorylase family protein
LPVLVIPAAGAASRFEGWTTPKPFLPFRGDIMLNHVRRMFPKDWVTVVGLRPEHKMFFEETARFPAFAAYMDHQTQGPAETVALAAETAFMGGAMDGLDLGREPLVVCDCDTLFDARAVLPESWADGVVAMRGCTDPKMSYVERSSVGNLWHIHEKPELPPSTEGVTGVYSFDTVNSFFSLYATFYLGDSPKGEWFLSRMLDYRAHRQGCHVRIHTVPEGCRISTGSPQDYLQEMANASPRDLCVHDSWSTF